MDELVFTCYACKWTGTQVGTWYVRNPNDCTDIDPEPCCPVCGSINLYLGKQEERNGD